MEKINSFLQSVLPAGLDWTKYLEFIAILAGGMLIISVLGCLIFGKRSTLNDAVSSSIAIVFMYVANVAIFSAGLSWSNLLAPLPFIEFHGDHLTLFPILSSDFNTICSHVLDLIILAFVMNLLQTVLPKGKHLITWYFWRFVSLVLGFAALYVINILVDNFVPASVMLNAPMVLLIILVAALLLGALKLLVGGLLAFVDPLLAILYTFFFSTIVGKQLSKAILTTTLLTALVCLLDYLQIASVFIAAATLQAYIPLLIIALVLWYVIGHLL